VIGAGSGAISVCDVTRPQPRELMLGAIMEVLDGVIRPEDVVVLIATGTHRASTTEERRTMLGDDVLSAWRVIDHDARDATGLVDLGMVGDVPVWLAREWVEADIRITTGFVEPHFFAGFSGGPKMVAPGLAGLDTTLELHNARRIGDTRATWGVIEGNPVHDAVRGIALATGVDFALDVLLDDEQRITRAFAGEILAMHAAACVEARHEAMQAVDEPFDLVITSNSGYPLDQNLSTRPSRACPRPPRSFGRAGRSSVPPSVGMVCPTTARMAGCSTLADPRPTSWNGSRRHR
jgi:nickel-dependent lactate racemase